MRRSALALLAALLSGSAVHAQNAYVDCPTILPHDAFLHRGGKLALLKLPAVPNTVCASTGFFDDSLPSKTRFEKRCDGSVAFHAVIRTDGSVRTAGVAHIERAGIAPVLHDRALEIRFAPPRLQGAPVCIRLDVSWDSAVPGKFNLPDGLR